MSYYAKSPIAKTIGLFGLNHPSSRYFYGKARDFSEAIASLASLCSLLPSAKTVHRTVFFRKPLAFSLLVRIPFYEKKNHHHKGSDFIFGGEQGIRTLEQVIARYTISNRAPSASSDNSPNVLLDVLYIIKIKIASKNILCYNIFIKIIGGAL